MKNILSVLLSAVIILSGLTFAYADDPEEALPPSSGASAYSVEEQSFIDQASDDTDRDLRTLSVEVVRAASSTYSVDNIYNLLISVYTTYTGRASWAVFDQTIRDLIINDFRHYDSNTDSTYDVGAMLWSIRNVMLNLQDELVPATALVSPSIYQLIDAINDTLSLALVDSNNTPYLVNIYNKLADIDSGTIDYTSALFYNSVGVAEYASRINSSIVASYNGLSTQLNKLDDISTKLTTVNTSLQTKLTSLNTHAQTIENKIDNQTSTLSSDLSSSGAIASSILDFRDSVNNINWSPLTTFTVSSTLYPYTEFVESSTTIHLPSEPIYLVINKNVNNDNILLHAFIPYFPTSSQDRPYIPKIEFYYNGNILNFTDYFIDYDRIGHGFHIYLNNPINLGSDQFGFVIKFTSSLSYYYNNPNQDAYCEYINKSDIDYYTVSDNIILSNLGSIMKDFKDLYASDDLIAAKQDQQAFEDQVIDDFTGSGSAAAKASDAASAKDISSAVSSGLNSGGSVNNSLSVFNPSGGFWGWFSQENSNYINNLSSQTRLRSSGSGSDWVIYDPYQRNAEELQSILGGDR